MAKATTTRVIAQFPFVVAPQAQPQKMTFFAPPQGMDIQLRLDQLDPKKSRLTQNLLIRDSHYIARDGTTTVGGIASHPLLFATAVKLSTGKTWNLRWTTQRVEYFQAGAWHPASGITYSAPSTTQVSTTGWNDTIVFTIGIGKLLVLSFPNNVPTVAEISASPENVGHVTTFAGRIIASIRNSSDIFWCVKNDNTDWTGQGSGNEPLKSAPGGSVDQQTAVVPVSDEYAYCVRTNSVWQMTLTGDPDAPFRFSVLYQGTGSEYPGAVVGIRRGVCYLSRDNIVMITPEGIQNIGQAIREEVRVDKMFLRDSSFAYDERNNELCVSIPTENSLGAHPIYRFNLEQGVGGWVKELYPFPVKSISFIRYFQALTIDELTGTIDQLQGAIDDLGQSDRAVGLMFAMSGASKLVARNTPVTNNNPERDINSAGITVPGGWRIETGYIVAQDTTAKVTITQIELEYEAEADAALTFEYSDDGGYTWQQYAARVAPTTTHPKILRVRHTLERENIVLAVNCEATPNFRLIGMHVYASTGGQIEDAR